MIPKIIHQIWLGPNPIPEQFNIFRQNNYLIHGTSWEYYLWKDDNIDEFDCKYLLDECESLAAKSDVISDC